MARPRVSPKGVAVVAVVVAAVGAAAAYLLRPHDPAHGLASLAALDQTLVRVDVRPPIGMPGLEGRWSLVFFGFTACPHVCPTTLAALAETARAPASGIGSNETQVVFVSVDPENDTPARLKAYLASFDARFVGMSGDRAALERFAAAAGAGYQASGAGIDHSTSVFVVDPRGRLAGVLLRPTQPARILADLHAIRGG